MKCPNCEYIHGTKTVSTDTSFSIENVEGGFGGFYRLPINLERNDCYNSRKEVFGCPACKIVFFED